MRNSFRYLKNLTSTETSQTVRAERAFLNKMEGGCQVPIAGFAQLNDKDEIVLTGLSGFTRWKNDL